jgi:hypothetical protein
VTTAVSSASAQDVDVAVKVAKAAFKSSWGLKVPGSQRGRLLNKLADIIEAHRDELAALEALNTGKMCLFIYSMITDRVKENTFELRLVMILRSLSMSLGITLAGRTNTVVKLSKYVSLGIY